MDYLESHYLIQENRHSHCLPVRDPARAGYIN